MRKFLFLLSLIFLVSCSSDDGGSTPEPQQPQEYVNVKINGIEKSVDFGPSSEFEGASVTKNKDVFTLSIRVGANFEWHAFNIIFTKEGKLISAKDASVSASDYGATYYNYRNFPSNYFTIQILSLDETSGKIKMKFNGLMHTSATNFSSETIDVEGNLSLNYSSNDDTKPYYNISGYQVDQYCYAKLNNNSWIAYQEYTNGIFTSVDPYKIEVHFASNVPVGSYNVNPTSTGTYIKFSKFNTTTLTYDDFQVTGTLSNNYSEYHGGNRYSFIGAFNFTAVNPNNPSEVINMSEGNFRSYQQF